MIPKIIHYCWLSDDPYPELIQKCIASWKAVLPDWELRLWDKECLKEIDDPWVHEAYEAKVYAHASDFIRLYAVYNYGGFYLDCDVEVIKDFAPLLRHRYVFSLENPENQVNGIFIEAATFGAEAGNELLKECMTFYHGRHFINPDGSNNIKLTIPYVLGQIFGDFQLIESEQQLDTSLPILQVLPAEYFSPKSGLFHKMTDLTPNTYSIHHFQGAWIPMIEKLKSKTSNRVYSFFGNGIYSVICKVVTVLKKFFS